MNLPGFFLPIFLTPIILAPAFLSELPSNSDIKVAQLDLNLQTSNTPPASEDQKDCGNIPCPK